MSPLSTPRVFVVVVFLGLFGIAARNATDPDLCWHLRTGQMIAESGIVPRSDPFSFTRAGAPWIAHEWLSELFLWALYRSTGMTGLILVFAAITGAAFVPLFLRSGASKPYIAGVATLACAWATVPLWGVRPQIISLLLASVWLLVL